MLIGISGKKQSGKSTLSSYLMGEYLKKRGVIQGFAFNSETGQIGFETPLTVLPVAIYSYATLLKEVCVSVFGLTVEQVNGTDEMKNSTTKYKWEDMPFPTDKTGNMTAREFMETFGTKVCRKMYQNVWTEATMRQIAHEQKELAIISDVRFPNEVEAIKQFGGIVIRLNRNLYDSQAESETALDVYEQSYKFSDLDGQTNGFDYIINNQDMDIYQKNSEALKIMGPIFDEYIKV